MALFPDRIEEVWSLAETALNGVGDVSLGQWVEITKHAIHIRRRLSGEEQEQIGQACDLRGTDEAVQRLNRALPKLPAIAISFARQEIEKERQHD